MDCAERKDESENKGGLGIGRMVSDTSGASGLGAGATAR
jgi:hypothetical protein